MIQKISSQIDNINSSLKWIKKNRPNDYEQKFIQLIECRRILKRIQNAANNNPGIAAFGKSQVGKSYLISCLLQGKDAQGKDVPFEVKTPTEDYEFVTKINPPSEEGGGRESTGVVSRFSSFKRNKALYSKEYPVLVNLFSVTDIILILADSYFFDFSDYTLLGEQEISQLCDSIESKYQSMSLKSDAIICADDILNIKYYFAKHLNQAQALNKSKFFDCLALLVDRIPVSDYAAVFANLWNNDPTFTLLFNKLLEILSKFDFAKRVYLPIESVVHKGIRENTIMSVQCLKQLFTAESEYRTDVYVNENGSFVKKAAQMPKSEICAICSEVVFKIEESFLSSERPYSIETMDPSVRNKVTQAPIKMEILENNDLLDFPGARAREQEKLNKLGANNILDFFLRGKVAYLFNKYNEEMGINILLYCHHNKDNDVTNLYQLLEDWVHNYVGATSEERRRKIEITKKSPLFYIGTMFNLDLVVSQGADISDKAFTQRWTGRFNTVVNDQCFHRKTADWVKNWTQLGVNFKNSYVLRDYKFSQNVYDGFYEVGQETGFNPKYNEEHYKLLRETFITSSYVRELFENPAVSWDVASSRNNDGALYIIENLGIVAASMDAAREHDFQTTLSRVCDKVLNAIKDYFVSTDADEILEGNIRKARSIFRELDFTCNSDNYYFGHLIQALQLTESVSYQVVHAVLQGPEINSKVNDFKDYEIIRNSCKKAGYPIEDVNNDDDKWNCVISTYGFTSKGEAEDFLTKKGIDVRKLFDGSFKRKMNSCIIGDAVYDKWCSIIKSIEFLNQFSKGDSFDSSVMTMLVDNIIRTADTLNIRDRMAESIAEFVNVIQISSAYESLLADMLASIINDFIIDFGFKYLDPNIIEKAKIVCEKRGIPAFKYICKDVPATYSEEDLTAMFDKMSTSPHSLLPSFDNNYNCWLEYMFISFIAHLDLPKIEDREANAEIDEIITKVKTI